MERSTGRGRKALFLVAVAALALPAQPGFSKAKKPAANPVTVQAISAKDKQTGAQAHPELLAEFGGALTGSQASYVESVGKTIALQSGLSNARSDFTVSLLNSPVNNAFAIPGGYIYVTRQLVALMNNEAELASVLGHEVGHVAARHSRKREKAATQNAILGALGQVLIGAVAGNTGLGQLGQKATGMLAQGMTLKFSRAQETEADNLGIEYLRRAGYDPRAMANVLSSLANQNALDARLMGTSAAVPVWASTHPDPGKRVAAASARAGASATGQTNRDVFLRNIDGIMVGDDPKQGVVEGRKFTHPDLRLGFDAPSGFVLVNGPRAVAISGQSGKGEFSRAAYSGDLEAYVRTAFTGLSDQTRIEPSSFKRTTVNGIPAAYGFAQVPAQSGPLDVVVFAYEFSPTQAFHFIGITPAGGAAAFESMYGSMKRISPDEAAAVRPRKLAVLTVRNGDTVQALAESMAYADAKVDRFMVLNGLTAQSRLVPGQKVKIVSY